MEINEEIIVLYNISRFNPYSMDNDLILKLNTGREKDFNFVLDIIKNNIKRKDSIQHILLNGPRGMGKSFFLILLDIKLKELNLADFVLLPEEQVNIYQPVDLIREVKNHFLKKEFPPSISNWFYEGKEAWDKEVNGLEKLMAESKFSHLVVAIENLDLLLGKGGAFETDENQYILREFLTKTTSITLIATTIYPDLDSNYDKALFHFFAKHELQPWEEEHHRNYFMKRLKLESLNKQNNIEFSEAQLKALIRFTGGSPRLTVIMVDILVHDNLNSTTKTLERVIDDLTPFYQDLLARIPPRSRLLFDALIRGGEPCSQSDMADRVNAMKQNLISQGFGWLITNNYLIVDSPIGVKQRLYSVRDRLFVHFYQMRYINHGTGKSMLASMSEFLTRFYNRAELKNKAIDLYEKGFEYESQHLIKLAFEQSNLDMDKLPWKDDFNALIKTFEFASIEEKQDTTELEKTLKTYNKELEYFIQTNDLKKQTKKQEEIGWCLRKLKRYNDAIEIFKKSLNSLNKDKNFKDQAWILTQIGLCFEDLNSYNEALEYYKNVLELYTKENNTKEQAWIFSQIGLCFHELNSDNESIEYYNKALELYIKENNIEDQARVLVLKGICLENYDEAIEYYNKALNLYTKKLNSKNKKIIISIKVSIALTLFKQKKYKESLEKLNEANKECIKNKEFNNQASIFFFIGVCLIELNKHEEALEPLNKSVELYTKENDFSHHAFNYKLIGLCLEKQRKYDIALEAYQKAINYSSEDEQGDIFKHIGVCLGQLNRYTESLEIFNKSLDSFISLGNLEEQAFIHYQKSIYLDKLGKNQDALEEIDLSLKIYIDKENFEWQAITLRQFGYCLSNLDKYPDAIEKHKESIKLFNEEVKTIHINELAWNYRQMGFCLEQLNRYEEALDAFDNSMKLYSEDENFNEHKGWLSRHMGRCLGNLKRYIEALPLLESSLNYYISMKNLDEQAFILNDIGWFLRESGFYIESINTLKKANDINVKRNYLNNQAHNLQQIGFCFGQLIRHEEALEPLYKSIEIFNNVKNNKDNALSYLTLAFSLWKLGRQDEALKAQNKALELFIQENEVEGQIISLGQLGVYQGKLKQYETAINTLNKALELSNNSGKYNFKLWLLSELFSHNLLFGKEEVAWEIIDETSFIDNNYKIFNQIGKVIYHYGIKNEIAKAYSEGHKIFENIYKRRDKLTPYIVIQQIFLYILNPKVNLSLIEDLFEDAVNIFGQNIKIELSGIYGIIIYLKSNKNPNVILNMEPDVRRVVETLIKEMDL